MKTILQDFNLELMMLLSAQPLILFQLLIFQVLCRDHVLVKQMGEQYTLKQDSHYLIS